MYVLPGETLKLLSDLQCPGCHLVFIVLGIMNYYNHYIIEKYGKFTKERGYLFIYLLNRYDNKGLIGFILFILSD